MNILRKHLNKGIIILNYANKGMLMGVSQKSEYIVLKKYEEGDAYDELRSCSAQGHIKIPANILKRGGFGDEQIVNVATYPNSTIVIAKVGAEIKKNPPQIYTGVPSNLIIEKSEPPTPPETGYAPVEMKRGQIKIPASILEKAGITPNAGIVVWLNNNSGRWIDIKVLEATDKGLNDRKNVLLKAGQYLDRLDGLKYKDFLDKSNLLIPASYRKQNGIISATGAICNVWFDDKRQCIVVETPETMCDFSHDQVRSIPAAPVNVPVCAECAPEVKPGGKADRLLAIFESINDKLEALGA